MPIDDGNPDPVIEEASYEWPRRIVPYDGRPDFDDDDGGFDEDELEW